MNQHTPSQGLQLVKSMIHVTPVQSYLVQFKLRMCCNSDGSVGAGYWRLFTKRNGHTIISKPGNTCELDRAAWSTYRKFDQIYNQVDQEIIKSNIASVIYPSWMDAKGNAVKEANNFGCKLNFDITRTDMVFTMDEVGENISQKGYGRV